MEDLIRIKDEFYIRANSSLAEEQTRVLKHGEMFAIFNKDGNICPFGFENHGIYYRGTRYLSRFIINIDNKHPLLLSSTVKENNELMVVDLTNPDIEGGKDKFIPKGQIHIFRSCFIHTQTYHERIRISNYELSPVQFAFNLELAADFKDIFEIRGLSREKRGVYNNPVTARNSIEFTYDGLDKIFRSIRIIFVPEPISIQNSKVAFHVTLAPKQQKDFFIQMHCRRYRGKKIISNYEHSLKDLKADYARLRKDRCTIETSNEQFNDWLNRSSADLFMMLTETKDGLYPYAGIPWFSTVFGRDGIITALETLWIYPKIARGVLEYLSKHQAKEILPDRDAEPGKILHEVRNGEMANLKEIPFGKYYGSIDSTLLYLILAGHYYQRSGDIGFIKEIWPCLKAALKWTYEYGDRDGDGFIEYENKAIGGLSQQGWKDSKDSIFHQNGSLAEPPIALCEVQGYLYESKLKIAIIAKDLGEYEVSRKLLKEAVKLKKNFLKAFWCNEIDTLAIALDGRKKPCKVLSSNPGHCLFSGIVSQPIAGKLRKRLMSKTLSSGWGIRTLADSEVRYNPMSYHNGSVWPHDNALIAYGLSRYGFKDAAIDIMTGLFDASIFMDLHRLPELFCGFPRRPSEGPTLYPVACNPQAWSSAAVFMLIQACLGMSIDAKNGKIHFNKPSLPNYLEEVKIKNLGINSSKVDINFEYHPEDVGIKVVHRKGKIEVVVTK